ncbi:stage II sporulation protein E [Kroppenstedtia eburnea]|uniref:Stage II sporulation protein E n=1 Tax=Kroppenstedtia eburnea TaxID=714067 RepID=A0A1N7MUW6_9BACL|nr:stage II sporulation protein E [Kroppenstedtia eburnea]QKI80661.1 stage II sporulation protein E [Kroppenstedtia eburnea]SIS89649.1 stage II sporulation protein E [Kroppenstedtia eburnea]
MQMLTAGLGTYLSRTLQKLVPDRTGTRTWQSRILNTWNLPVIAMGFLLGRAMILDTISPFALAYMGVVIHLTRRQWPLSMIALILGAATLGAGQGAWIAGTAIWFLVMQKVFHMMGKGHLNFAPFVVLTTNAGAHLLRLYLEGWTSYTGMLAGVDVLLSFILTFIFVQSLPLFTLRKKKFSLRHEEIVCLVILAGSVVTGMLGWKVADLSVVHVVSRYLILVLALVGGGMLGASVGVVTGMILSLADPGAMAQISLLAFAGLLAGLFKEARRWGVAIGFVLGTLVLTLYGGGTQEVWISLQETVLAMLLFLLTPKGAVDTIARLVPGTSENESARQEYTRRLRDVTAAKVEQFTELFSEMARSFREDATRSPNDDEQHMNRFIDEVMDRSCRTCHLYRQCWEKKFVSTYNGMTDLMAMVELNGPEKALRVPRAWSEHCVKAEKVLQLIREGYGTYEQDMLWRDKLKETRRIVSEQLEGVSEVMEGLAAEIRNETHVMAAQEEQIHQALEDLGLSIQRVEVINLEEGKVEIEVALPHTDALDECRKLVAPLVTEIVGEPITVQRKVIQGRSAGAVVTLGSAQRFEVKTGVAGAAKGGHWLSGDSYCYMNVGTGKYAVAISDGMGNGTRAQQESSAALQLLRKLLQSGMKEEKAVETINSILSLRSTDEMFATIDLAMVDLNSAGSRFLKIGSTPGFVKRGNEVMMIAAGNPPLGILHDIDVEPVEFQLQPGDLVVMMTDGIYDAPRHASNKEACMKRLIAEIKTKDPQGFADCLLEQVIRHHDGEIEDDMTVVVSKVETYVPEWATIRIPGVNRVEREHVAGL